MFHYLTKKLMKKKRQARGGFTNARDNEIRVHGETVLAAMAGNPHFTTPHPELDLVRTALEDYSQKLAAANKRGGPEQTALKEKSRLVLEELLKRLAFYVSSTAAGDLSVLLSSGFRPFADSEGGITPGNVLRVVLKDGRQYGQLLLSFESVKQALFYEYRYGPKVERGSEPAWGEVLMTTTSRSNVIAPVTEGTRYFVQVRAVNKYGKSDGSTKRGQCFHNRRNGKKFAPQSDL
jgi:hypothetical protein